MIMHDFVFMSRGSHVAFNSSGGSVHTNVI